MKIIAIRGKNLASLEGEFEINFTTEPLKSAGIFAITGPTGSGKSTVLDSLCLALFDNTPRTNRAGENIQVPDVQNKTINQKDSRTILRRGAGEGYAEVDFISLAGEIFRSTWSVKRARSKADGTLQNSEIRLINLSTGAEVQGRKTELLTQISQLIGLSFDQFTRAVLLAQGDFATFLKARQPEKAEILEKLTGTDIYSRISVVIFDKNKKAEQELILLEERIQNIELLSEDQIKLLSEEKKEIDTEISSIKKKTSSLKEKIKWIEQDNLLRIGIEEGKNRLSECQKQIEEAKPRYEHIAKTEKAQEIRDVFNEWDKSLKLLTENLSGLEKSEKGKQENLLSLERAKKDVLLYDEELKKLEEEIFAIEPEIIKARELDTLLFGAVKNTGTTKAEYENTEKLKKKAEKSISDIRKELELNTQESEKLAGWFEKFKPYSGVFSKTDLIISLLNDAGAANSQRQSTEKLSAQVREQLVSDEKRLEKLNEEAERLEKLLPVEISKLRMQLREGLPCPVCGSTHHPLQEDLEISQLQEEELNKAKEENSKETERLKKVIESRKEETARLNALHESYRKQSAEAMAKATQYLDGLPGWEEAFKQGSLQQRLQKQAALWEENTRLLTDKEKNKSNLLTKLEYEENTLTDIREQIKDKKQKWNESVKEHSRLAEERKKKLGGEAVDEVVKRYTSRKEETSRKQKKAAESQQTLSAKDETYKGMIRQAEQEIKRLAAQKNELNASIDEWVNRQENITREELSQLLSQDARWIATEKQQLDKLREAETASKAVLLEREKNHRQHQEAEQKPADDSESVEALSGELSESEEIVKQKSARASEVELILTNHQKNEKRIREFDKELSEKRALSLNWKKLNELFGSASGSKFKEIAQGYTLEALLSFANVHLRQLSDRYLLQRIPNTLALQIVDTDMLNEIRTVHSLSGGESFLVSLALALGLSSLSSNQMKVESLFIDEGFGTLDVDTLRIAMDALERLQTQGRKIGVISHVPEMTERVSAQIRVIKSANGKSRIEIKG